ncbi:NAD(P)-dependent oxidoreductase [Herbiconiux moechotypicola]|uniref:NAD(P)-dependent oxidoreductase n=1 Tax=Herbiconiux moechotypicola TaxID=637393 RepID=A0ABN3DXN1_9MICO|nr:NAD(P)-dependent oxidoreductase [Herbiconiux moechotypicola]MCS5730817.1 NAD(P)-dependent oxidoreductase [Herbiconiux moechotypicola]
MSGSRASVAFVGLGNMGTPMAERLVAAGHEVIGFDLAEAARERLQRAGGRTAATAAEAAAQADLVILMLPNSGVVEAVTIGDGGVLAAVRPGTLFIDMSSSEPLRTRALAEAVAAGGARLIDAPVSGGVKGAVAGTLTIMVGGAEADLAEARGVLEVLGKPALVGPVGAGHALKAINNLMSAAHLWVTSEAMLTGIAFGLDPSVMLDAINTSSGRSGSTQLKWPNFIVGESYDSGFGLGLMLKDMRIATGLAESLGVPHTLSDRAVEHWSTADAELGQGADHTEVAKWLRQQGRADARADSGAHGTAEGSAA